jgi:hypothetical protein
MYWCGITTVINHLTNKLIYVPSTSHTGVWWRNLGERDHLGDPGIDGRIILRWIFRKWDVGDMDRIELAQDMGRWRALVNAVMNLWVP